MFLRKTISLRGETFSFQGRVYCCILKCFSCGCRSKFACPLIIHTAPQEIEWHKEHDEKGPGAAVKSGERELMQRELAGSAHLVAAVGPQLYRIIKSSLRGTANPPPIVQVNPWLRHAVPPGGLPDENLCLLLGRAEDRKLKGLDIAARAVGLLSHPFHPEPILVVRGAETGEGDQLHELLREISQKPAVKIRVKEYTPDLELIRQDIRQSAVVLMPSLSEGFGLSGLEAIAEGIPILMSDRSGLGELLKEILSEDQARNFVVKVTSDLEADGLLWAASIDFVLRDLKAAFNRAEELKNRLQQELTWEKAATQLLDASDSP